MNPKEYINNPANYPKMMTYADAARILKAIYVDGQAGVCRGKSGACMYIPSATADRNIVGCAFAVLTHPDLRLRLQHFNQASADHVMDNCPLIADYFEKMPIDVLTSLQRVHDRSDIDRPSRDLASRMMGAAHVLAGVGRGFVEEGPVQ